MSLWSKKVSLRRYLIWLVILYHYTALAQKQNLDDLARAKYVEKFTEYFFVWPVIKQRSTSFTIQNIHNSHQKLNFKPDVSYHAGAGAYIFGMGIQFVLAIPPNAAQVKKYGDSEALDLQANVLSKNWGVDIFTQHYRGYYQDDPSKPVPANAPNPQRKDVSTWNTGVVGAYYFDKRRFSIRSTYNYFERQLKSAGSFLLSGNMNTFQMHADSAIYSGSYESVFGPNANFNKVNYITVAVAPGYAHNFVMKNWFIGASLALGPGVNWIYYQSVVRGEQSAVQLNTFMDLRLSLGYNSERFFSGITYNRQSRNISYVGVRLTSTNDVFKFAIGYRFHQVGILKKRISDIFKPKSS